MSEIEDKAANLRRLIEKATPAPWAVTTFCSMPSVDTAGVPGQKHRRIAYMKQAWGEPLRQDCGNAELIVAAINALPAILDRLDELERRGSEAGSAEAGPNAAGREPARQEKIA